MSLLTQLVLVALLSAATGVISKTSDLFNDDGLRSFRGASPISGVFWAITGSALIFIDKQVAALWLATVMYWFLRHKLDHFNHAFAGVSISGAGVFAAANDMVDLTAFIVLLVWLAGSGYLNTWLKDKYAPLSPKLDTFLRLRLRYYIGPIVLAVVSANPLPAVSIIAGMSGTEVVTGWWRRTAEQPALIGERR